jgi:5-methylcytosine-specific restriction protein A
MSLNSLFSHILNQYHEAKATPNIFTNHPLGKIVRNTLPIEISDFINNERYKVTGSIGAGNWAAVPWIGIFDKLITDSAQRGYYVVYLFNEDCSGLHLSLNQGVTTVKERYGTDANRALEIRAHDFLAQLGHLDKGYDTGKIDLCLSPKSTLGKLYEKGSICSKYYSKDQIPSTPALEKNLSNMLDLYLRLTTKEFSSPNPTTQEDDEVSLYEEDLCLLKEHKRIERNQKLAKKAKEIHGYICKACKFDFFQVYGAIGANFIEAHHLTPLAQLKGHKIKLNPKTDFSVLCSNCHRMIHKSTTIDDVEAFRDSYLKQH